MFEKIQNNPALNNGPVTFTILHQMVKARETSHNHPIVEKAYTALTENQDYDLDHFGREALRNVWSSNLPFTTKYLATLWWGNTGRNFSRVFTPANMKKLSGFAYNLENDLSVTAQAKDINVFWRHLNELFNQLDQQDGAYKLSRISYAFFSKMLQFYFASHPIAAKSENSSRPYIPVISDQWIMKAVYVDMTDALRAKTFSANAKVISLKKTPDSYRQMVDYFNSRSNNLGRDAWEMEELLFRNPQVAEEWKQLFNTTTPTKKRQEKPKKKKSANKIIVPGRTVEEGIKLNIKGNPNHILYIGKNGKGPNNTKLPYFCQLFLNEKEGDLKKTAGPALLKALSSVLTFMPPKAKAYIFSTNETTYEEAKAVYEKAMAILLEYGANPLE